MVQQATVAAVGPSFQKFLERWPPVADLAGAPFDDVLGAWAGLGYYARARNLHKCARHVAGVRGAVVPDRVAGLRARHGMGPNTAAAIAAIAFDGPAVVVDGNVERVRARLFAIKTPLPAAKPELRPAAARLSPQSRPGDFAQACMDLGATICTPRAPRCILCPWADACAARSLGAPERFPFRSPKALRPTRQAVAFVLTKGDAVWLRRRPDDGLLGGMLEAPSTPWRAEPWTAAAARRHVPLPVEWTACGRVSHGFTHFTIEFDVWRAAARRAPKDDDGRWCKLADLNRLALPTLTRRVLERALLLPAGRTKR